MICIPLTLILVVSILVGLDRLAKWAWNKVKHDYPTPTSGLGDGV